jgi:5-methylthioadenosine/S-adenosylhomocysteine deaminase
MTCTVFTNMIIFTVNEKDEVIKNGTLIVRDGKIEAVGKSTEVVIPIDATEVIDGDGKRVLIPGLIDTHNHSSLMRGVAEDMRLVDWLPVYDLEHKACVEEDAYHASRLCYLECLKNGTTTILDMYRFAHRAAEAAGELGIRLHLAPYAADVEPYTYFESTESNLKLIKTHHNSFQGRIKVWMGLENLYYCSEAMYKAAIQAQKEYGVHIHTHGCEQKEEEESIYQMFGKSTIDVLEERGILGPSTLLAHCVWVNEADIQKMADTGTNLAHCPTSAAKLGCGIAPITSMLKHGVNVSIGSDGCIDNNSMDLFQEIKFASLIQKAANYDASVMGAKDMLRIATINGAKSLGVDHEIGSLEVGKLADIVMVDVFQPNLQPVYWNQTEDETNLLWNLIFSARGSNVDSVMVGGEFLVREAKVQKVSEMEVMFQAQVQGEAWMRRREHFKIAV